MLSIEEIRAMSPEEQAALKKKLTRQVIINTVGIQTVKWTLIGATRSIFKALNR